METSLSGGHGGFAMVITIWVSEVGPINPSEEHCPLLVRARDLSNGTGRQVFHEGLTVGPLKLTQMF